MFAPAARSAPTRLPWGWWPLIAAGLLTVGWPPAFAAERPKASQTPTRPAAVESSGNATPTRANGASTPTAPEGDAEPMRIGPWQLLTMPQMWRAAKKRSGSGARRMLPLAVMPTERGAWWVGLSTSRATGEARVELRFTMPLDGSRPVLPHERD